MKTMQKSMVASICNNSKDIVKLNAGTFIMAKATTKPYKKSPGLRKPIFISSFLRVVGLMSIILVMISCDTLQQERLEQLQYFLDTKALSEQYTAKLKIRLANNPSRIQELQSKYQLAQSTHNRLLGRLKLNISTTQSLSKVSLTEPSLLSNDSAYLRYVDALDQSTSDEKGFITSVFKSSGSALKALLGSSSKMDTRTELLTFIETQLMWSSWENL